MNIRKIIKPVIFLFSVTILMFSFMAQTKAADINLGSQSSQDMGKVVRKELGGKLETMV